MSDAAFGHNWDGDSLLDAANHLRVAHTRHTTSGTDISGDALQGHHGTGSGSLGDTSLFGCCHVHNHTALEHLCQVAVQGLSVLFHFYSILLCL